MSRAIYLLYSAPGTAPETGAQATQAIVKSIIKENGMDAGTKTAVPPPKGLIWTGRIISGLVVLFLISGSAYGIINAANLAPEMARMGYPAGIGPKISITCILCALIYAFPRTAVLGAILLTGYMGGATATHVRIGEPFFVPVLVCVLVWLGVWLRDEMLRALTPLRR
jgi:DoxX-like family